MLPYNPFLFYRPGQFIIEFLSLAPKVFGREAPSAESASVAHQLFEYTLLTLRLFKSGPVHYWVILQQEVPWTPLALWSPTYVRAPSLMRGDYLLEPEEVRSYQMFWQRNFERFRTPDARLKIALKRFSLAVEQMESENRLIDLVIGLEALFLKRSDNRKQKRLAERASDLLAKGGRDRAVEAELIMKAYDLRSEVVHGGTVNRTVRVADRETGFGYFVRDVEDRLRWVISEGA